MNAVWLVVMLAVAEIPSFTETMTVPSFSATMASPVVEVESPKIEPAKPIEPTKKPVRRRVWVRTGWFGRGHWEWR